MPYTDKKEEVIIQGIGVSPGIAIGPSHVEARGVSAPDLYEIPTEEIAYEQGRFEKALVKTKEQISEVHKHMEKLSGTSEAQIFEAHLMIIEDSSITKKVFVEIEERHQNAEYAFYAVIQTYVESMRRVNDSYLSERASDLDDICSRVLRNFSGAHLPDSGPDHQHVLITFDLAPSDTAVIDKTRVLGFATEQGSVTSHTAILARSLGIPAIVGLKDAVMDVHGLTHCILDGDSGKLILFPKQETIDFYQKKKKEQDDQDSRDFESSRCQKETKTQDGHKVTISANIEFAHEIEQVQQCGAEGVGLFRTEFFLLKDKEIPSEDEQFEVYKKVAIGTGGNLAIIRTLDSGGDKLPAQPNLEPEPNPFLGWRGIRVSLILVDMFKDQLRAILRASAFGRLGIMFPLISGKSEVVRAKVILQECRDELDAAGIAYDKDVQVGVMIEVPSAAIIADKLAPEVDFFSIGTNDLIQYTVAVDRVNSAVSHLYKPCNPAVIRLIKMTVDAGKKHGIWTGVCGEMAGVLELTPLLIGLGVEELSVATHQLPKIKQAVARISMKDCSELAKKALDCDFTAEVRELTTKCGDSVVQ